MESVNFIDIVFDGPPSHESGRFVEVENAKGESINAGEWIDRGNGLWALRLSTRAPEAAPGWQLVPKEPDIAMASEGYLALQGAVGAIALASGDKNVVFNLWKAMLSTAPSAPSVDSGVSEREKELKNENAQLKAENELLRQGTTVGDATLWLRKIVGKKTSWTAADLVSMVQLEAPDVSRKDIYNGIGYLARDGVLKSVGYGRYEVLKALATPALPVVDARNEGIEEALKKIKSYVLIEDPDNFPVDAEIMASEIWAIIRPLFPELKSPPAEGAR